MVTRIKSADIDDFEQDQKLLVSQAFEPMQAAIRGGVLKFVHGQKYHAYNPDIISNLQQVFVKAITLYASDLPIRSISVVLLHRQTCSQLKTIHRLFF